MGILILTIEHVVHCKEHVEYYTHSPDVYTLVIACVKYLWCDQFKCAVRGVC